MDACQLTAGITAFANIISQRLNDNELGILAVVCTQLGDTLATIAAHRAICESVRDK